MKRLSILVLLAILGAWAPAARSGATPANPVFARLEKLSAGIETLSSDFTQEKHLAVFNDKLVAQGHFAYRRPDCLRWEITSPVVSGFALRGTHGVRWQDASGKTEKFNVAQQPIMGIVVEQLLAWTRVDLDRLSRDYDIAIESQAPVRLRLAPKGPAAQFLDHLIIVFSPDGRHVAQVEVHEKDGDFTRITFHHTVINGPLAKDLF